MRAQSIALTALMMSVFAGSDWLPAQGLGGLLKDERMIDEDQSGPLIPEDSWTLDLAGVVLRNTAGGKKLVVFGTTYDNVIRVFRRGDMIDACVTRRSDGKLLVAKSYSVQDDQIVTAEVYGEGGNDHIQCDLGLPTRIWTESGDDLVEVIDTVVDVQLGDGNDEFSLMGGQCNVNAGPGCDYVIASHRESLINNPIVIIDGGPGDDLIDSTGFLNSLKGGSGDDLIIHRFGLLARIDGQNGNDYLIGSDEDGIIRGGDGDDVIQAGDGDETVYGGFGNDIIVCGAGDHDVFGGPGNDLLYGGDGDDDLYGEDGDDRIKGDNGDDYLSGGEGNDRVDAYDGYRDQIILSRGTNFYCRDNLDVVSRTYFTFFVTCDALSIPEDRSFPVDLTKWTNLFGVESLD
ncbi:MAG: hypothetical protein AAFV88_18825 [Planctomycetota bacterium]